MIVAFIRLNIMNVDPRNPYQPPSVQDCELPTSTSTSTSAVSRTTTLLVPPILTVACTLVFWLGFASVLGQAVNARNVIFIWSATLLISVAVSTYLVNRIYPRQLSALSVGVGYVLFGIVFCLLEGDTSNGTDLMQALVVYGTLTATPLIAFALTWMLNRRRVAHFARLDGKQNGEHGAGEHSRLQFGGQPSPRDDDRR